MFTLFVQEAPGWDCCWPLYRWSNCCICTAWCKRWGQMGFGSRLRTTGHPGAGHCTPARRPLHSRDREKEMINIYIYMYLLNITLNPPFIFAVSDGSSNRISQIQLSFCPTPRFSVAPSSSDPWWQIFRGSINMLTRQLSVSGRPAQTIPPLQYTLSGSPFMHVWLSTTGTSIHLSWLEGPSVPKEKTKAGELTLSVHTTYTEWHILPLLALPSSQKRFTNYFLFLCDSTLCSLNLPSRSTSFN